MERLDSVARRYAWGSATAIPEILGVTPDGNPWAELWLSAHPQGSSVLARNQESLYDHILGDPVGVLGADLEARFGARLPFLMKIIAPERPLSIQVHPNSHQAQAGFEREAATLTDETARNYVDPFHKPEMLYALKDFEILAGFRPAVETALVLRAVSPPGFEKWATALEAASVDPRDETRAIHALFTWVGQCHEKVANAWIAAYVDAASRASESTDATVNEVLNVAQRAYDEYPGDRGILLATLLNREVLAPGEAAYVDAGVVHCYLGGLGIEVMASSDNVLRAGLTPKYVDLAELMRTVSFKPGTVSRVNPRLEQGFDLFTSGAEEFNLRTAALTAGNGLALSQAGPRLLLAIDGEIEVRACGETVNLRAGESLLVRDADGAIAIKGSGRIVIAESPTSAL